MKNSKLTFNKIKAHHTNNHAHSKRKENEMNGICSLMLQNAESMGSNMWCR